jgi:hypothetical protein
MRETCARVLAAALMTGAIATAMGLPTVFESGGDPGRRLTAPPSSLQRSVSTPALLAPERLPRAEQRSATALERARATGARVGPSRTSPTQAGSKPRPAGTDKSPVPAPAPKPQPAPEPSPAPAPAVAPATRDLASTTPAPAPGKAPEPEHGKKKPKSKDSGKGKPKGKEHPAELAEATPPPAADCPDAAPVAEPEQEPADDGQGHGKNNDKGDDKDHGKKPKD